MHLSIRSVDHHPLLSKIATMEVLPCLEDKSSMDVKEFDETKAGVKGLVDSGTTKVPKFFIYPRETLEKYSASTASDSLHVPLIDLEGFESSRRKDIIYEIREACEKWGVFQLINHGVPVSVMDAMIAGAKGFHEQPNEVKQELYTRDPMKMVKYFCNSDLFDREGPADWMDNLTFHFDAGKVDPEVLPHMCRDAVTDYVGCIIELKKKLSDLLSEALGLCSDYLATMECMENTPIRCNYYPACPEPALTLGSLKHTDPDFMTVVLQDNVGGLQVLHQNVWVDVSPVQKALVVNMGDLMQLITNDKFKSVEHRVLTRQIGPRVSIACFFYPHLTQLSKPIGPIRELLSNQPAIYRETNVQEYMTYFLSKETGSPSLPQFKVQQALGGQIE